MFKIERRPTPVIADPPTPEGKRGAERLVDFANGAVGHRTPAR